MEQQEQSQDVQSYLNHLFRLSSENASRNQQNSSQPVEEEVKDVPIVQQEENVVMEEAKQEEAKEPEQLLENENDNQQMNDLFMNLEFPNPFNYQQPNQFPSADQFENMIMPIRLDFIQREMNGINRNQSMAAFDIPNNIEVPNQNQIQLPFQQLEQQININDLRQGLQIYYRNNSESFEGLQRNLNNANERRSSSQSSSVSDAHSSPRSIPDEHHSSISEEEYIHNYQCIMKGVTWTRDSHGLFDYETRHPLKKQMKTEVSQMLVRTAKNELHLLPPDADYEEQYKKQAQLLLTINKIRNKYFLEAPKMPKNDDLLPQYQNDDQLPNGENPNVIPAEVTERMYLVVRSLKQEDKKVDYKLKKHDIIKLGRVKFKVKEVRIKAQEDERDKKRKRRIKKFKKLQEQNLQLKEQEIGSDDCPELPLAKKENEMPEMQSERSKFERLEGEESFVDIECVLPQEEKQHVVEVLLPEAVQKTERNQEIENLEEVQQLKKEDQTNVDFQLEEDQFLKPKEELKVEESIAAQNYEQAVTKMDPNENMEEQSLNKELPFCRFCWVNETTLENPLLSSCKCRGGVQYVHYECLKSWLNTKRNSKENAFLSSYYFKQFECEICKTPYPYVFKARGKKYNLIEINKPQGDYIILESLTLEKNTSRMVHLISPTFHMKTFKLGRGHDSDLRINDISVSRCHAVIKFKDDGFYLSDNMSKFGTLILIRNKIDLSLNCTKAVQVGRTVINFQIKQSVPQEYQIGEYIQSRKKLSEQDKQQEDLKKLLVNMQQAEDYIKKQSAEHTRLARTDNFHGRNAYMRRVQQNIHEEEIKIEQSVEIQRNIDSLFVNRILEHNNQRRQELLNYIGGPAEAGEEVKVNIPNVAEVNNNINADQNNNEAQNNNNDENEEGRDGENNDAQDGIDQFAQIINWDIPIEENARYQPHERLYQRFANLRENINNDANNNPEQEQQHEPLQLPPQ